MRTNWRGILEQNEEKIKDQIRKAYEMACDGTTGVEYTVELDAEGRVGIGEYVGSGSTSYGVWEGTEMEVARIKAFDCWDGDDFNWFPKDDCELTEEEKTAFAAWCKQNGEEPEPGLLSEWNPEVAKRWEKVYREEYIAAYADDYAGAEFSRMFKDLEMLEKYAEL